MAGSMCESDLAEAPNVSEPVPSEDPPEPEGGGERPRKWWEFWR